MDKKKVCIAKEPHRHRYEPGICFVFWLAKTWPFANKYILPSPGILSQKIEGMCIGLILYSHIPNSVTQT